MELGETKGARPRSVEIKEPRGKESNGDQTKGPLTKGASLARGGMDTKGGRIKSALSSRTSKRSTTQSEDRLRGVER